MARVVQRRGGPPYLLIIFVFLTVVAATLAVLFYNYWDGAKKAQADEAAAREASETARGNLENTVVPNLIKVINGKAGSNVTDKGALADATAALGLPNAQGATNLVEAVVTLDSRVGALQSQVKQFGDDLLAAQKTIGQKDAAVQQVKTEYDGHVARLTTELAAAGTDYDKQVNELKDQLTRAKGDFDGELQKRDARIAELTQKVEAADGEVQRLKGRIDGLVETIAQLKGEGADLSAMTMREADGKVVTVLAEQGICYVDLGEADGAKPGLTLSVYSSREGIPEEGKGKAKLQVVSVDRTTSQCKVTEAQTGDTIVPGDLVANLVFDRSRTYKFVVEGEFDLYGEGRTDPQATGRVRNLIKSFGGVVSDSVTVDTDYVVMGQEPPRPPRPDTEDATPVAWTAYNQRMKVYQDYNDVLETARALRIHVVNTNRFLAFTGFVPKRTLQD